MDPRHLASASASTSSFMEPLGDSFSLFLLQIFVILTACRLTSWALSKINLPGVVGEMIAGVILGPTVLGRIPGWTTVLFPSASMPVLSTVATFGLCFFMFVRVDTAHGPPAASLFIFVWAFFLLHCKASLSPFPNPTAPTYPRLLGWRWTLSRWPRVPRPPPC